jgi:hypothetical protein
MAKDVQSSKAKKPGMNVGRNLDREKPPTRSRGGGGGIADFLVKLIVLATPICYALGRTYAEGYWHTLGISPSAMARSFEDYVFMSFLMIANGVARAVSNGNQISFVAALVAIVSLLLLFSALAWLLTRARNWFRPRFRRFLVSVRRWSRRRQSFVRAFASGAAAYSIVNTAALIFLVGSLALLLPLTLAFWLGQTQAERLQTAMRTNGPGYERVVATNGDDTFEGRLIECNEHRCVLFVGGQFVPFPSASVRWVVQEQANKSGNTP